jgi:hypothetical protein
MLYKTKSRNHYQIEEVSPNMIEHLVQDNQLPKELKSVFDELEIFKHLLRAGIKKNLGFTLFLFIPACILLDLSS